MDSIMLQGDSISMRTIAIVTLIFLPTNTVAVSGFLPYSNF
jgi:hypothetical protein